MGPREGGELGWGSDSGVKEPGLNRNHWNNYRLLHEERAFLNVAFEGDVSLYCYKLDCR